MADDDLLGIARLALDGETRHETESAAEIHHELIALGGRIAGLTQRPETQRVQEARDAVAAAREALRAWDDTHGSDVQSWESLAATAGVDLRAARPSTALEQATNSTRRALNDALNTRTQAESIRAHLETDRAELNRLQALLAEAHEHSSALVEGLTALRTVVTDTNVCPVCDRSFTDTGSGSLVAHVDAKLSELTTHAQQLLDLRTQYDQTAARVTQSELAYDRLVSRTLSTGDVQALQERLVILADLTSKVDEIEAARTDEGALQSRLRQLTETLNDLEAASAEADHISGELARHAARLEIDLEPSGDSFAERCAKLVERAESEVSRLASAAAHNRILADAADRLEQARKNDNLAVQRLVELAERKKFWNDRYTEARRRQDVAKEVREAATTARTRIVHRVFTRSLNDVWKSVFTRLAPNEGFIPRFAIPNANKKSFDITLETIRHTGEAGGPPEMMLSAGNLNTAALSLFLALHLAVAPIVPCLVLDDPVQAMDEVHVAQFAGLIRVLAKQNGRQVVIAVHERELFDYLSLELSPAYEGDELITIELGGRALDEDGGITRHKWAPDSAIAG